MKVKTKNIKHQSGTFLGANQSKLYYQSWHPKLTSRAILVIVHGLGAHSGIFSNLVEFFGDRPITIYALDLRGHGRSNGQRGYIKSWSEFRQDLDAFLQLIKAQEPKLPLFLLGQSLGGTIALDYALRYGDRLQGLILLSPALKVRVSRFKSILGRLLTHIMPRFALDTGIYIATISREPQVVAGAIQDPLRHTKVTARLATEFWRTVAYIEAHAAELKVPLLILHGGADLVTPANTSRALFATIPLADKERYVYLHGYHELHNDRDRQRVFADLEDWIDRHVNARSS